MKTIYLKKHLRFLRTNFKNMMVVDLTAAFNKRFGMDKSQVSVKAALHNHKIISGRKCGCIKGARSKYTKEQVRFLKNGYKKCSRKDLCIAFNNHFGCNEPSSFISAYLKNHKITSGRSGCFPKGHIPSNKGIKGIRLSPATEFKKGHVPANLKPLGYERHDKRTDPEKENYTWVKVAEKNPYTKAKTRFRQKHILEWEKHHGMVPKGFNVIFKDGNTRNCAIDNLTLVSRAEHARLNQLKYRSAHPEIKPALMTMAKLKTKLFKIQKATTL